MYFSFSKLKKWGKKTAAARRHNCAVLPKEVPAAPRRKFVHSGRLRQHGPLPITPIGESRAVGQAVGRVKIMFQNIYEIP